MTQFEQMKDAHKNIYLLIANVRKLLTNTEENSAQIAKEISRLSGSLKVHLGSEDRYLYSAMQKSSDLTLQKKAKEYQNEMGSLSEEFMAFKDNYNTQSKIIKNLASAEKDINNMFKKIEARMHREDNDLYPLASKVM